MAHYEDDHEALKEHNSGFRYIEKYIGGAAQFQNTITGEIAFKPVAQDTETGELIERIDTPFVSDPFTALSIGQAIAEELNYSFSRFMQVIDQFNKNNSAIVTEGYEVPQSDSSVN